MRNLKKLGMICLLISTCSTSIFALTPRARLAIIFKREMESLLKIQKLGAKNKTLGNYIERLKNHRLVALDSNKGKMVETTIRGNKRIDLIHDKSMLQSNTTEGILYARQEITPTGKTRNVVYRYPKNQYQHAAVTLDSEGNTVRNLDYMGGNFYKPIYSIQLTEKVEIEKIDSKFYAISKFKSYLFSSSKGEPRTMRVELAKNSSGEIRNISVQLKSLPGDKSNIIKTGEIALDPKIKGNIVYTDYNVEDGAIHIKMDTGEEYYIESASAEEHSLKYFKPGKVKFESIELDELEALVQDINPSAGLPKATTVNETVNGLSLDGGAK